VASGWGVTLTPRNENRLNAALAGAPPRDQMQSVTISYGRPMLPLLFAALLAIGIMGAWPNTSLGRWLRRWLVEAPARALSRITPRRMISTAALAALGAVLFLLFETEGLRLFAMAAPELIGWAALFDLTVALDVVASVLTVAAGARLKPLMARARLAIARITTPPCRAARALRARITSRPGPRRSDDPEPGFGYAFG
jgi:hypothetical protein